MKLTLVVSSQRSGSTLLCRDVQSLGGLGNPKEYLLPARKRKKRQTYSSDTVKEWIASGITPAASDVTAVKMMVNVAGPVDQILNKHEQVRPIEESCQAVIDWARREYDAVSLLFLIRENTVDQAISRVLARATGRYHSLKSDVMDEHHEKLQNLDDTLLYPDIAAEALTAARERRIIEKLADANKDIGLLLTYQQLVKDEPGTSGAIFEHAEKLGFAPKRRNAKRSLKKAVPNDVAARLKAGLAAYLDTEILQHLK